ncbi:hypothetical protein [Pseudomonas rubra]|uniref:Uncharacterized protein n=1 Tax=Pseudomonas rubra TaxID=2942627 RepID=A0ABT5PC77_9PSED|nr:hypothetical protein [Pseudomonas rubra]MDD1015802.1 hypothetical protein [Pseudomonas rubra]MDD1036725.1 hypothetical protein [Pseudomonas rubra]MDD1157308.1 hypothetical protein [Pseudomonas rubra]
MSKIETKHPLTIIAILAGVIEASALASLPFLSADSQGIYTWFLVGFPFFLTVLFFLTLNFNNKSLYSPDSSDLMTDTITAPAAAHMQIVAEPAPPVSESVTSISTTAEATSTVLLRADSSEQNTVSITLGGPAASELMEFFTLQAIKPGQPTGNTWTLYNLNTGAQTTVITQALNKT